MGRKHVGTFQPGNLAKLEPQVAKDQVKLPKIIGITGCDISELEKGLKVISVSGDDIILEHPRTARKIQLVARNFYPVVVEKVAAEAIS